MISIILNLLLAGLLCGAIWMGWRLNERLKVLRQGQMGFAKAVADNDAEAKAALFKEAVYLGIQPGAFTGSVIDETV